MVIRITNADSVTMVISINNVNITISIRVNRALRIIQDIKADKRVAEHLVSKD